MTIFFGRRWEIHFTSIFHPFEFITKEVVGSYFYMVTFKELQQQVAEQKKLLQSVASFGEELLNHQTAFNGERYVGFSVLLLNSRLFFFLIDKETFINR